VGLRIDSDTRALLRRAMLDRGRVLATLLSDVLAGKDKTPALVALLAAKPGIRPAEALRKALDHVERRRALLDGDDDRFGRCDVCGLDLGSVALGEMPWADRCVAHSS
jgi:hypothetical protein